VYLFLTVGGSFSIQLGFVTEHPDRPRKDAGTARIVERGDADYDHLWRLVNDNNRGRYDAYQQQTARAIPLVVVNPT
jgi:F420H(2)-dependent quinone reductase